MKNGKLRHSFQEMLRHTQAKIFQFWIDVRVALLVAYRRLSASLHADRGLNLKHLVRIKYQRVYCNSDLFRFWKQDVKAETGVHLESEILVTPESERKQQNKNDKNRNRKLKGRTWKQKFYLRIIFIFVSLISFLLWAWFMHNGIGVLYLCSQ